MKTLNKKILTVVLGLIFAVSMAVFGATAFIANADVDLATAITDFKIVESAQVRVGTPSGIRFMATVDKSDFDDLGADAKMGMLIAPVDLIPEGEELEIDTVLKGGYTLMNVEAKTLVEDTVNEQYLFNAVMTNVKVDNLNRDFTARAYITLGEQEIYSGTVERSPVYVASASLADGETADLSYYLSALPQDQELTTSVTGNSATIYVGDGFSFDTYYGDVKVVPSITIGNPGVLELNTATNRADDVIAKASGSSTITVSFNGKEIVLNVTVGTMADYLASKLTGNELMTWKDSKYIEMVSDTTVTSKSSATETNEPYVNVDSINNDYFYNFAPLNTNDGSGKTFIFPKQEVHTDGYVKIKVVRQGGNYVSYNWIEVYKVGETSKSNYIVKPYGTDLLLDTNTYECYVPVSTLTNENGVLEGIQIVSLHTGWLRIYEMSYVPANEYTATYTVTTNLDEIAIKQGGSSATVTASVSAYDGASIGAGFGYSVELVSSNTDAATVSGMTVTPVNGGDTTLTLTIKDKNGNVLDVVESEIHVDTYADQIASTLGENELVNWKSSLQKELITDTTISTYANKELNPVQHGDPYYTYQFYSADRVDSNTNAYVGHNIEFAKKNTYSSGVVEITILSQRGAKTANIYKFGETNADNIVQSCYLASGNTKYTFQIPVKNLVNEDGVLEGMQIVINLADGVGGYYGINYRTTEDVLSSSLGENQLVNWNSQLYGELLSDLTISGGAFEAAGYEGKATINTTDSTSGYYRFVADYNGGRTIKFPTPVTSDTGYIRVQVTNNNNDDFAYYNIVSIYKVGETDSAKYVKQASGTEGSDLFGVGTGYLYIPVEDLANDQGVVEGIQIAFQNFGYIMINNIDYVAELPNA